MPVQDSNNNPAWRIILSNLPIKKFKIIDTNKYRRARILNGSSFGRQFKEGEMKTDIVKYIQNHIFVFGVYSRNNSNRYTKEEIGMSFLGFEVLLSMMQSTGYKYSLIIPNIHEYYTSLEVAIQKNKTDSNEPLINYMWKENIFISNHKDISLNTPIPNNTHIYFNSTDTKNQWKSFNPEDSIKFTVLGIDDEDNTPKLNDKKMPKMEHKLEHTYFHDVPGYDRKGKGPATGDEPRAGPSNSHENDLNETHESNLLTRTPDNSEIATPSTIKSQDTSIKSPSTIKSHDTSMRSPQSLRGNSGNGDGPRYQEENPDVSRVLFDDSVNNLDSLYNNVINNIGNKYINPKLLLPINPKLLNVSPFINNLHKYGRKDNLRTEMQKKINKTCTYKKFL